MMTYEQAVREGTARLNAAGSPSAGLDVSLLLAKATGKDRLHVYSRPKKELSYEEHAAFEELIRRREGGEPVAYILQEKEFYGLTFKVTPGVLIPRPDSETLIATLEALVPNKEDFAEVAEVGVGSGALIISILHSFPNFKGYGVDIEDTPLEITAENAATHNVADRLTLKKGNWLEPLEGPVNIVISNPPYIRKDVLPTLARDVRNFEPHEALDGGEDGLDAYRVLIPQAYDKLKPKGLLLLEIGYDQKEQVQQLFNEQKEKWTSVECVKDLAGNDRVFCAVRA